MQPLDVYPIMLESPVKRTLAQIANIQSSAAAAQPSSHEGSSSSQSNELEKYLATNWVQRSNTSLDVLRCWKENSDTFPISSRFAREVLSVPVSTMSSEATFSSSGRILDDRRMSLTSDMVEILKIVQDWEQAEERSQESARNSKELTDLFTSLYVAPEGQSSRR